MKPTIGLIVHYKLSTSEAATVPQLAMCSRR
jgi:hypothetical protein